VEMYSQHAEHGGTRSSGGMPPPLPPGKFLK